MNKDFLVLAMKGYLRRGETRQASKITEALSRSASRQREANRNGQRDMGAQKQDQENSGSGSTDNYRVGRSPSLLDRCS